MKAKLLKKIRKRFFITWIDIESHWQVLDLKQKEVIVRNHSWLVLEYYLAIENGFWSAINYRERIYKRNKRVEFIKAKTNLITRP